MDYIKVSQAAEKWGSAPAVSTFDKRPKPCIISITTHYPKEDKTMLHTIISKSNQSHYARIVLCEIRV